MSDRGWALVTGAARRIGRALAVSAAEAGFDIIVHAHSAGPEADETVAQVRALGRRARVEAFDLGATGALADAFADRARAVTLLVNCASLFEDDRIETVTSEGLDRHFAVNLRAPVLLARAFAAALPAGRDGLVVNITDQKVARLTPRFFSYTLTKAALWTATLTLAQALAPRIRVNAIAPGPTLASVHQAPGEFVAEAAAVPLGHGPTPEEIGAALRYLIDAPSVTGQMIAVDGGQHLAWRTPDVIGD
ncbi:MAG: SDR family oxidoreductase [Caulobacteraceae bacterium]|nr:SDR family oxidoreductase [Caulobacteraceae bacterium]